MKRSTDLLSRLLLLVLLLLASVPSGATETVCVLDGGKREIEVARCGMPCCADEPSKTTAPTERDCCAPKRPKAAVPRERCDAANACRCETRVRPGAPPGAATALFPSDRSYEPPAVLPPASFEVSGEPLAIVEPRIGGLDAGPPRKRPRAPRQSRAPPRRLVPTLRPLTTPEQNEP